MHHSSAARMETVSATLQCATVTTIVETTVMNSDVVSQNNATCQVAGPISSMLCHTDFISLFVCGKYHITEKSGCNV